MDHHLHQQPHRIDEQNADHVALNDDEIRERMSGNLCRCAAYANIIPAIAEARVNIDTGEVRVPRLLGVFAVGRIINAKTARSQFLGGMTMGLSMALHEQSILDPRFGDYVNHDFAEYHIATNADVGTVNVTWIDEVDPHLNPMGAKGIGEVGIVGTAAAIANAVYHATGIRIRDLPITLDKLLS